jgi:RNA polymerase sigma factor (sigma-70 family)
LPDEAHAVSDSVAVRAALATLAPKQRAVIVLRYFEDLTEAQTADVLGCRIGTVKSQTRDALARRRAVAPGSLSETADPEPSRAEARR